MSRQSQSLYDRHITIFSPEGKLYQVEYAFRAVKGSDLTAIAVKSEQCVCVVVQRKITSGQQSQQDRLLDTSYVTSLYKVTDSIGLAVVGIPGDCKAMVQRSRHIAADFGFKKGYKMPVHYLCHKVANVNQMFTQHAYLRLHACTGIFVAIDDEKGPSIYRFDPAGWYSGYNACGSGTKEQEATNVLEKLLKKDAHKTIDQTIEAAISSLQTVLSLDFKPDSIEVGVITVDNPEFRKLDEEEIDKYLNSIAQRD